MIDEAPADVTAALEALPRLASIDSERMAVVGASYTGEAAAAAARAMGRYQAAYVALSPGDFSAESIAAIDGSGADWLMLRAAVAVAGTIGAGMRRVVNRRPERIVSSRPARSA